MFTQGHYIKLATVISSLPAKKFDKEQLLGRLELMLELDNSRFNKAKFHAACTSQGDENPTCKD